MKKPLYDTLFSVLVPTQRSDLFFLNSRCQFQVTLFLGVCHRKKGCGESDQRESCECIHDSSLLRVSGVCGSIYGYFKHDGLNAVGLNEVAKARHYGGHYGCVNFTNVCVNGVCH